MEISYDCSWQIFSQLFVNRLKLNEDGSSEQHHPVWLFWILGNVLSRHLAEI